MVERWRARDVLGMRLRDLLDVDAAHVAEDHAPAASRRPSQVTAAKYSCATGARCSTSTPRGFWPLISSARMASRALRGRRRIVGELDAAGLHAAAGQHLRLEHHGAADLGRGVARLGGRTSPRGPFSSGIAVPGEQGLRFVLVEPHRDQLRRPTRRRAAPAACWLVVVEALAALAPEESGQDHAPEQAGGAKRASLYSSCRSDAMWKTMSRPM